VRGARVRQRTRCCRAHAACARRTCQPQQHVRRLAPSDGVAAAASRASKARGGRSLRGKKACHVSHGTLTRRTGTRADLARAAPS
jgi:hypothetical protein